MRVFGRKLVACAAMLAAFAMAMPGATRAAAQDVTATPERAAALTVTRPPAAAFLDLWVTAYTPPRQGAVEAVVSIGAATTDIEVGRFAVFPAEPFTARQTSEQRAYRFDASAALQSLKRDGAAVTVRVALIPIDDKIPALGAKLVVGKAAFSARR